MQHYPLPVIVISSLTQSSTRTAMEALNRGAVDVLAKPGGPYSVGDLREDLPMRVRAAASARLRRNPQPEAAPPRPAAAPPAAPQPIRSAAPARAAAARPAPTVSTRAPAVTNRLIAIGASTGGTQAIEAVLTAMPAQMPPIVITQHIPAGFSAAFAERLNRVCALEVREARGGEILTPGLALIAPGNYHMLVERAGDGSLRTRLDEGPKVCYQRPSVDVMFRSIAAVAGKQTIAVLLTGMGSDGAAGMCDLRRLGAITIAQNEQSCVVFGMPREAIRMGGAQNVQALGEIGPGLVRDTRAA
jgi:two-component system chemotaxis response regulator CheB